MGDPQGYEELISCTDFWICGTVPYCMQPLICMMDPACAGKAQTRHRKAEVKVLGLNAQVWCQDPQVSAICKFI